MLYAYSATIIEIIRRKNSVSTFSGLTAVSANCLIFDQQDFSISDGKAFV
jgi:hypothetical protein